MSHEECQNKDHDHFQEWCQMTGWHGVLDFYVAKHRGWKLVWLFVVLGGCFFAINQSVTMIMDYATDDQWVTSTTYEMPKQGYLEWPNITICPLNWPSTVDYYRDLQEMPTFLAEVSNQTALDYDMATAMISTTSVTATTTVATETVQTTTLLNGTTETYIEPTFFADDRTCPNIIIQCGIQNPQKSYDKQETKACCNSSEYSRMDNRCFNIKPNVNFGSQNKNQGSRIFYLLDANSLEDGNYYLDASSGFEIRLYLGQSDSDDAFSSSFLIQPGTRNVIGMILEERKTTVKERPIRFSKVNMPCNKPYAYLKANEYTQDLCVTDCGIAWQMKYCNCYVPWDMSETILAQVKDLTNCSVNYTQQYICYITYIRAVQGDNPSDPPITDFDNNVITVTDEQTQAAQCGKQCPEPCTYRRVEAKLSSSLFLPPNKISKYLDKLNFVLQKYGTLNNYTEEQLRKLTMLELFYEMKQQRVVEKQPKMSIDDLISNIGGCLGVWSGISFLSLFQIGCFMCRAGGHLMAKRRAKRFALQQQPTAKANQAATHCQSKPCYMS